MENYSILKIHGRLYVLCTPQSRSGMHPDANFLNTKKALCGVVEKDKTLEDWKRKKLFYVNRIVNNSDL